MTKNIRRAEAVSGSVICRLDWIHDYKHLLVGMR